jgi:hypothetical protein
MITDETIAEIEEQYGALHPWEKIRFRDLIAEIRQLRMTLEGRDKAIDLSHAPNTKNPLAPSARNRHDPSAGLR